VVRVIHPHPEHLSGGGDADAIERLADPPSAVDVGVLRRVGQHREYRVRSGVDRGGRADAIGRHAGDATDRAGGGASGHATMDV
jgi:hypothetical protein